MNWRNFSAILTGLLLIAIAIIFWMWYENGRNGESAALDRDILIKGNSILKEQLRAANDSIKLEREYRAISDKEFKRKDSINDLKISSLTIRIKAINLSKSSAKELDSLVNILYGKD